MNKNAVFPLLLIFILPFIYIFFKTPHFFVLHDGIFHLQRTYDFFRSFTEGNIPVRWTTFLNNNFGSPIFIFLFPVPYVISSFFYFLTGSLLLSYKFTNIFLIAVFGAGIYAAVKRVFHDKFAAVFGVGVALFTPYFLVQIFVRGAFRELTAISFFPWVIFYVLKLHEKNSLKNIMQLTLAVAVCFLSDGLTFYTLSPFLIILWTALFLTSKNRKRFLFSSSISVVWLIALDAFMIFPYIFEIKFIRPDLTYEFYKSHFVLWQNLFSLKWNFGFSEKWFPDRMPLQLGLLQTLVFLFAVIFPAKLKTGKLLFLCSAANLIFVLMLAVENFISQFLWDKIHYLRLIQFPWRLYSSLPVTFAICGAYSFLLIKNKFPRMKTYLQVFICLLPLLLSFKYLKSNQIWVINEAEIISKQEKASAFNEFIPAQRNTTSDFDKTNLRYKVINGKMKISNYRQKSQEISFQAQVVNKGILQINQLYFPGWRVYINNRRAVIPENVIIPTSRENTNQKEDVSDLFWLKLDNGNHRVKLKFEETPVRRAGNLISVISIILLITLYAIPLLLTGQNTAGKST